MGRSGALVAAALAAAAALVVLAAAFAVAPGGLVRGFIGAAWVVTLPVPVLLAHVARRWRRFTDTAAVAHRASEVAPQARLVVDEWGHTVYTNTAFRNAFRPGREAPLQAFQDLAFPDETTSEELARLRQSAAAGLAAHAEVALAGPEGETNWWRLSTHPLGDGLILWCADDITGRRALEDTVRSELAVTVDAFDALPAGLVQAEADGRLRLINQRLAEWADTTAQTLRARGHTLWSLFPDMPDPRTMETEGAPTSLAESAETYRVWVRSVRQGGLRRLGVVALPETGLPPRDATPAPAGGDGAQALVREAPVGIVRTDSAGTVVEANPAFHRLAGVTDGDVTGHALDSLVAADDAGALGTALTAAAAGEAPGGRLEVRLAVGEGTSLAVFPAAAPAEAGGGAVLYAVDATAQKNLEVQFAHAQKMQAMGQLAGGVAHDFNNLLTAIIGYCDLLLQRHTAGDPSFADIMQVKQNANRAANLVRQLLAFSRRQTMRPRTLDVTDALTELSHLLRRLLGERINLDLVHGRELWPVRADPGQFDQVIINLAVNARDAMPDGGTLTIGTSAVHLEKPLQRGHEEMPAGDYVCIQMADTGHGIDDVDKGRIFEPFFSTKPKGEGTGLGLSTVYGIVRQTGGFILVDDAPGGGARFSVYLPRQAAEAAAAEETAETTTADLTGAATILLVEDEDAVRTFAARALRNKGYDVLEARDAEGALQSLEGDSRPEILVTDVVMPGMDGVALARRVRETDPAVRVVLISGYAEDVARDDIAESEDFHFLGKPFSLKDLAAKVKELAGPEA